MKINNKIYKLLFTISILFFSSCETVDLDLIEDPSKLNASFLDPEYTFNYVQLQLPEFVDSSNDFTQRVIRQMAMTGGNTYDNAFAPVNFNGNWSTGYRMLNAIKIMEPKALETKKFYTLGAAKIIRCYVLMTLVDMYGDIPYTDMLQGNQNLTPRFDNSAFVYKKILQEIDEAVVLLKTPDSKESTNFIDLYYKESKNWITLANTLKLKMYVNSRLAATEIGISDIGLAIKTIVTSNDYIDTPAEDFAFKYGSTRSDPNSRHPLYNDQYELGGGSYISNYIMWAMTIEKGDDQSGRTSVVDPRTKFYFYKQDASPAGEDAFTLPLGIRPTEYDNSKYASFYYPGIKSCYKVSNWFERATPPGSGYWGRDHGDNSGIPPDAEKRSVGGYYPIGGILDDTSKSVQESGTKGALGAGIMPILLSSYVHFMLAEAYYTLPTSTASPLADAKSELFLGISQSIDKSTTVKDYPQIAGAQNTIINAVPAQKTAYLSVLNIIYDDLSNTKKLEFILKEYYIAAWGNGIEPYNNYRRTGFPSNFQPTLEPESGAFFNTAFYPASSINNNPNCPSSIRTRKVFWDKANINLH